MAMLSGVVAREKSPEAFRTISEVAVELDIPQHVLRFWETRFAQVRPVKRAGGRRYYRPEDVDLLKGIRALLYREGFTIKGAQKVIREQGIRYVAELGRAATVRPLAFAAIEPPKVEPRHARAVLAVVEHAHGGEVIETKSAAVDKADAIANVERAKLQILLTELTQMKARLRAAMPQRAG